MPFYRKRRSYGRRKRYTRKRMYRKRYSKRGNFNLSKNIHYIKRQGAAMWSMATNTVIADVLAPAPGTELVIPFTPRMGDLPGSDEFYPLYDMYRLKAIKVSFIPMCNTTQFQTYAGTGTTGGSLGATGAYNVRSYTATDYNLAADSGHLVTTIDQLRQYQSCKWKPYTKIHSRYFKPKLLFANNTVMSGRQVPWLPLSIDSGTAAGSYVRQSGLYFCVDATNLPAGTLLYKIEYKMYLQFKAVR